MRRGWSRARQVCPAAPQKLTYMNLAGFLQQRIQVMDSTAILSHLCAAEFRSGDVAYLVAWSNGEFGIVRNGQLIGQQRWGRQELADCGKAFLNYVRIIRNRMSGTDAFKGGSTVS